MTIDELLVQLQQIKAEHGGDTKVWLNGGGPSCDVEGVLYRSEDKAFELWFTDSAYE